MGEGGWAALRPHLPSFPCAFWGSIHTWQLERHAKEASGSTPASPAHRGSMEPSWGIVRAGFLDLSLSARQLCPPTPMGPCTCQPGSPKILQPLCLCPQTKVSSAASASTPQRVGWGITGAGATALPKVCNVGSQDSRCAISFHSGSSVLLTVFYRRCGMMADPTYRKGYLELHMVPLARALRQRG